ncbi:unnamed protein product [Nesidiocoris tenuis]|uniref:Uncharacterized protein n=2 Tax=Nesidiocoris tenuis TaxID=355587 RepID=A0A6H5HFF5_9HEMI|nr:Hypothetical protein NTJ_04540 [Nesidiocoris tenuis]CAB0016060.1 unnamed protein product [Nesidiocoris tenuis]
MQPAVYLFVLCLIAESWSLKCWDCRSDSDPKCADPFDNSTVPIKDCRQEPDLPHLPGVRPTMCRKIRQKVHGQWRYFRSCAYLGQPGIAGDERFCLMRTGTYNIFMEYCTCNSKDGCNTGALPSLNWPTLLFVSGLAIAVTWSSSFAL